MAVQFNEDKDLMRSPSKRNPSKMTRFVIRIGLAKNEKQAQIILLLAAVLFFILIYLVFTSATPLNYEKQVDYELLDKINNPL